MTRRKSYQDHPFFLVLALTTFLSLLPNCKSVPLFNQEAKSDLTTELTSATTTTSKVSTDAEVCVVGDVVYSMGDVVPAPDSCKRCHCLGGRVSCESVQCDHKPGCRAVQRSDQCCPDYICECKVGEHTYDNGARIPEEGGPCQVCYCRGGSVQCAVLECFWRDDCEPRYESGKCCPKFDHCPPPAGAEHSSRPMNNSSSTESDGTSASTPDLPVVKFQQVFPPSSTEKTTTEHVTTHLNEEHHIVENISVTSTEHANDEHVATTPVAPRTPTQDGGLVTESAVEAPSEPSSAPENLVESRSIVVTTTEAPNEEHHTTPVHDNTTDAPSKDNAESRTISEESTTISDETHHSDLPSEFTTIISSEDESSTISINTTDDHTEFVSGEESEARFDESTESSSETTMNSITTTDADTTEKLNNVSESEISTEANTFEHALGRESPLDVEHIQNSTAVEHLEVTTQAQVEVTTVHEDTSSQTEQPIIESRENHDELHEIQTDKITENLETTTSNVHIDDLTTENSVNEARTEETILSTTFSASAPTIMTEEIPTQNSLDLESRTEETVVSTETASEATTTVNTPTEKIGNENLQTEKIEARTEPTTEVTLATVSATPTTPENNKSVVLLLRDSISPAENIDEEHEIAKNLSINMDPAEENKEIIEEKNSPSLVDELAKSIEKADFPFNTTQNESSITSTTESTGYLFNDSGFSDTEFIDPSELLSPLSRPLAAPLPSYNGLNDWRIAAIQDASGDSIPWRDQIDLAADPGAGADILILPWSQQHLRRRRNSNNIVASYVQNRMRHP